MLKIIVALCLSLLISVAATAQKIDTAPSRINLGLNLATLISGLPEVQGEYYFNKYLGTFTALGYTLRPVNGFVKVGDFVDRESLTGAYWKLGIKARLFRPDKRVPMPWGQLLYIGSQYDEKGTRANIIAGTQPANLEVHSSGMTHGIAFAAGADFRAAKRFIIRVGFQWGYYKRNDHLGKEVLTYQPGFGSTGLVLLEQAMIGVMYRMGEVKKKVHD